MKYLFATSLLLCPASASPRARGVVAQTVNGPVAGVYQPASKVYSFKGIPFAEPPVGELRFEDTQPLSKSWGPEPLNATEFGPGCLSHCPTKVFPLPDFMCTPTVSEDCLFVNVFTPTLPSSSSSSSSSSKASASATNTAAADSLDVANQGAAADQGSLLPVIFWIHGGDYKEGAGGVPLYDGQSLANRENVVVVTMNYRLGVFGALYIPGVVKGNFAIKDQRQAMKWVQDNIKNFGGDPGQVTIAGQSSGAFSVAVHLTSPMSKGLFKGAIMASNPLSIPATSIKVAADLAEKVMANVSCKLPSDDETTPAQTMACLKNLPGSKINAADAITPTLFDGIVHQFQVWSPVVATPENPGELPMQPKDAFKTPGGIPNPVPIMMGTVGNETVPFVHQVLAKVSTVDFYGVTIATWGLWDTIRYILPTYHGTKGANFTHHHNNNTSSLTSTLPASTSTTEGEGDEAQTTTITTSSSSSSFSSSDGPSVDMNEIVDITTDYLFYCSHRYYGSKLMSANPKVPGVYAYHFNHLSSFNSYIFQKNQPYCVDRICHSQDLPFYFNPFEYANVSYPHRLKNPPSPTPDEEKLIDFIQSGWGNFAKTGNPNKPNPLPNYGIDWEVFSSNETVNNLVQQNTPSTYVTGYKNEKCKMWDYLGYDFN